MKVLSRNTITIKSMRSVNGEEKRTRNTQAREEKDQKKRKA